MRLEGSTTIDVASAFLSAFLERHNTRFAVPAADSARAWRGWPEGLSSAAVFCVHYPRRVSRDNTLSWPGGALALPRRSDGRRGWIVTPQERLDGSP